MHIVVLKGGGGGGGKGGGECKGSDYSSLCGKKCSKWV